MSTICCFFFQAEDGIRDYKVTGVQTCALPISFLWGFTWIEDLAKPDHLIEFGRAFDFWFLHISGLNLLPLLMAVVFYLQMKLQPKPVSMTKEQEQQQKIMMWMMPVLFPIMLYSGPSGLNLYILTSTLIGIVESK